jgi:hypothetical protein
LISAFLGELEVNKHQGDGSQVRSVICVLVYAVFDFPDCGVNNLLAIGEVNASVLKVQLLHTVLNTCDVREAIVNHKYLLQGPVPAPLLVSKVFLTFAFFYAAVAHWMQAWIIKLATMLAFNCGH